MEKGKAEVDMDKIIEDLKRAGRKLTGVAGLILVKDTKGCLDLSEDEANGLYYILQQISEEILESSEILEEVTP